MITWSVPQEVCPGPYNGKPLADVSLAAQKKHHALYLMGVYADPRRRQCCARGGSHAETTTSPIS